MSQACRDCPRRCGVDRETRFGVCGTGREPVVARAQLHFWEEPCISGTRGSGTVFFSGCPLRCVYCQNKAISAGGFGRQITAARLREIFSELIGRGAHNINLVTPTHFTEALSGGLAVPVVYNCGGYELPETVARLKDAVQVWLPDMKYSDPALAAQFSGAPDYPEIAKAAIRAMCKQAGDPVFDEDGMLIRGVLIRHLVLPGHLENTFGVIDWVRDAFPKGSVLFSLMSQYTPPKEETGFPELARRLTAEEYAQAERYLFDSGIEDGFLQELDSAKEEYTPPFDLGGV